MYLAFIKYVYITEQEVDGDTLVTLQRSGTIEQLSISGFDTKKKQMQFKKAVMLLEPESSSIASGSGPTKNPNDEVSNKRHKLTKAELKLPAKEETVLRMWVYVWTHACMWVLSLCVHVCVVYVCIKHLCMHAH